MDETLKMLAEFLKNVKLDNTKVNIYRGEPKPEFLPKDKLNKDTGRWFTVDKKYAQFELRKTIQQLKLTKYSKICNPPMET